ncbi:MAG TPA: DivIVA domain-containing protein [Candidatus Pseudogracilibacillus intestinigallinarum]|uniref:DivIVA domain-containing protein n=1 Tax=Candidatus Pseudogracilibacillus intestinigallinarum TaxID=2838742 RepID=A0A9D1PLU6_9BACI|nr:DivIVA domain-containing protein [Candidatus Pseudogracilibacillus intestinigallinarum]
MVLTPLDIHNKEFSKGFMGFNEDDVNEFLDQIIKDYEMTIREKNELQERVAELEDKVAHFKSIEETLNQSIVIAQETAEELKDNARKESKLIIKEAEKNADRILNEALSESRQIAMETNELKKHAKVFRTRLKMLIEAQLEMVNNDDWEEFLKLAEEDTEISVK